MSSRSELIHATMFFAFFPVKITGKFKFVWFEWVVAEQRYNSPDWDPSYTHYTVDDFFIYKIQSDDKFITHKQTLGQSFFHSQIMNPVISVIWISLFVMCLLSLGT